jgi:2,3-bisphosphoglycerate-independent phosphoglycerate mutase
MEFKPFKKLVLIVLDGFGVATHTQGNAVTSADPVHINRLIDHYPSTTLQASGPSVGLPWSEMGNSEVGHLNMGAGRIVGQDLSRITTAIEDRTFFSNPAFMEAINHVKKNNSALHLIGMDSPGGVHSYNEHLYALLGLAAEQGITKVYMHIFLDGRDSPPQIALESLEKLNLEVNKMKVGTIATITGRFYAMDRAEHWNLTEQTYRTMVFGEGPQFDNAINAVRDYYNQHIYDEMIPPTLIKQTNGEIVKISDGDALIMFNFRSDRALQITRPFAEAGFNKFTKPTKNFKDLKVVTMTEYAQNLSVSVAFKSLEIVNGLAEVISKNGLRQFHLAESEKYAHVSVFFNGGIINPFPGEERDIVTSPVSNYQNYADVPEMSARKITETLLNKIKGNYSFILVNFANPDMVGHTGNMKSAIEAVKVIDECLHRISKECLEEDVCLIITADHGNIEELVDVKTGTIDKEHSTNPVPFILVAKEFEKPTPTEGGLIYLSKIMPIGVLSDVAPTILELLALPKPAEMTGVTLLPQLLDNKQG